jgi:hypothetical protein
MFYASQLFAEICFGLHAYSLINSQISLKIEGPSLQKIDLGRGCRIVSSYMKKVLVSGIDTVAHVQYDTLTFLDLFNLIFVFLFCILFVLFLVFQATLSIFSQNTIE